MIDSENPRAKNEAAIQQHEDPTMSASQSVISSTVDHTSSISVHGAEEKEDLEKEKQKEEPYSIWTTGQLVRFLSICAGTGMISPLTASIYLPALNQIQRVSVYSD